MSNHAATPRQSPRSPWQDASKALLEAWKTLRKRWVWVVTLTTSTVIATAFYTAGQKRIYRSTCVLQIDPKPPKPLGQEVQAIVDVGANTFWANSEYYKTQFQIIQSRTVAEETVRRLGLHRDVAFLKGLGPKDPVPEAAPNAAPEKSEESLQRAAAIVRGRLSVEPMRDTRLVTLAFMDPNPERARQVLATLVNVYMDRNVDVAMDSTNSAADWLRGQVEKLKHELETSEDALQDYKTHNRILSVSLDDQSNMLRQEMQQLSAALTAVRVRRTQVAAQAEELAKLDANNLNSDLSTYQLLRDGSLQGLRDALVLAQADYESLIGSGKGEEHPLVAASAARLRVAREALQREVRNVQEAAQRELSTVEQEVNSLATLLDQAHQRAQELGGLEVEYRRLERSKTQTEKLYSLVIERSKESDVTRMMRFNNIQTIDAPLVPKAPVSPRVPLNMALGLVGGMALGLLGAFAREMFDQSVKTSTDIENLGMAFLGLLPRVGRSNGSGYGTRRRRENAGRDAERSEWIVHDDPTSAISEAARSVRTNLSFMSPDQPFRTMLVTSAAPSEGKTTVACWLATTMAQAGHRVLLVDCDLRRPRVHRIFDLINDRGVTSVLVDRSSFKSAVHETTVPGLSVLLSGPASPNPAENLQSKSFEALIAEMAGAYDRVVIDSPPVAPVTDAVILSTRVDATILVVRALASSRDVVRHAARALQDVRANLAGAVLNAADPSRQGYSYYHRYYGHGDGDPSNKAA